MEFSYSYKTTAGEAEITLGKPGLEGNFLSWIEHLHRKEKPIANAPLHAGRHRGAALGSWELQQQQQAGAVGRLAVASSASPSCVCTYTWQNLLCLWKLSYEPVLHYFLKVSKLFTQKDSRIGVQRTKPENWPYALEACLPLSANTITLPAYCDVHKPGKLAPGDTLLHRCTVT